MCVPCRDGLLCPWAAARPQSTAHDLPGSAWSLCVPVGGGPPARSPHASLKARSGRSRGTPWSCRHPPAPRPCPPPPTHTTARPSGALDTRLTNLACNSPAILSNFEIRSLELQRFQTLLNLHPIELHATFEEGQAPPPPTGTAASPCISCTPGTSGALHAGIVWSASMLHVIPLGLFRNLNCVRWYFNVSVCRRWGGPIELRASFLRNGHVAARGAVV